MAEGSVYTLPQPRSPCQSPIRCRVCAYLTSDLCPNIDKDHIHPIDIYRLWDMVTTLKEANHRTTLWRMVEPLISSKGYTLDPSTLPEEDALVASGGGVNLEPAHVFSALSRPAVSNRSGRAVFITMQDQRNHTIPVRAVLWYTPDFTPHGYPTVPGDARAFVVTKKYAAMTVNSWGIDVNVVPPDVRSTLEMIKQFFEGLEYMHSRGITHGDLGQHNMVLSKTSSGRLRYLFIDFELASSHPLPLVKPVQHLAFRRVNNAGPEYSMAAPYDPFANDIFAPGMFVEDVLRVNGYVYHKAWDNVP